MRTDVGLFDRLFGKRVTVEVQTPEGGVRKSKVSLRWLRQMELEGKITPASGQTVTVHILDPQAGLGDLLGLSDSQYDEYGVTRSTDLYRVEEWIIGEQISSNQFSKFREAGKWEVFVLISYDAGKPTRCLLKRDAWHEARRTLENI